jgi:hypothetical protein
MELSLKPQNNCQFCALSQRMVEDMTSGNQGVNGRRAARSMVAAGCKIGGGDWRGAMTHGKHSSMRLASIPKNCLASGNNLHWRSQWKCALSGTLVHRGINQQLPPYEAIFATSSLLPFRRHKVGRIAKSVKTQTLPRMRLDGSATLVIVMVTRFG